MDEAKSRFPFLDKHKRSLSFFGAAIVFATFVTKEGVGEGLRARLDTINNAETVYAIREDNTRISGSRINIEWREIKDKNSSQQESVPLIEQETDLIDETDDALNSSFSNLFGLERAARVFDARDIPSLDDEHNVENGLKDDYEAMIAGEMSDDEYLNSSPKEEDDRKDFASFESESVFNFTRNDLIGAHIIELIEKKIVRNEEYYHITNLISYFLFGIGWGLALIGRLFGVEGLSGE